MPGRLPLLHALLTCSHSSLECAKPGVKEALQPKMTGNRATHLGSCGTSKRNQQFSTTLERRWRQPGEHPGMRSIMNRLGVNAVEDRKGVYGGQSPAETAIATWPLRAVRKGETKSLEAVHCEMV